MMTLSTLPLLEVLYLLQHEREKHCHMVFSSLTRLSSHVAHANTANSVGCLTDERVAKSLLVFLNMYYALKLHQGLSFTQTQFGPNFSVFKIIES